MSTRPPRPWVLTVALCFGFATAGLTFAAAADLAGDAQAQLQPSALPSLLEPITQAGRKGWDCLPERQASAAHWRDAALPAQ